LADRPRAKGIVSGRDPYRHAFVRSGVTLLVGFCAAALAQKIALLHEPAPLLERAAAPVGLLNLIR
jgi:hypothetical protein